MRSRCSMLSPRLSSGSSDGCAWLGLGLGLGTSNPNPNTNRNPSPTPTRALTSYTLPVCRTRMPATQLE